LFAQANLPTCLYFQAYKAPLKGAITNFSNGGTNSEFIKGTIANVADNTVDGWDIVDHPRLPPPSHSEDVEHWTQAMFIDVTK
jgi:hypothetical protein